MVFLHTPVHVGQCPPCRGFTPVLAEFFDQLEEEDAGALQIVFASSDNDEGSFQEYYGTMPWMSSKDLHKACLCEFWFVCTYSITY